MKFVVMPQSRMRRDEPSQCDFKGSLHALKIPAVYLKYGFELPEIVAITIPDSIESRNKSSTRKFGREGFARDYVQFHRTNGALDEAFAEAGFLQEKDLRLPGPKTGAENHVARNGITNPTRKSTLTDRMQQMALMHHMLDGKLETATIHH